ncbi:hypothetical protein ACU40U_18150, partial [Staphylococcus arlettae]
FFNNVTGKSVLNIRKENISLFIGYLMLMTMERSVNFTVVDMLETLYSIYLSSETTRQQHKLTFKINSKKLLT